MTNVNTNNNAAFAATAEAQIKAGVEKAQRLAIVTTGLVIYGGEAALSQGSTYRQLTQKAKADCAKEAVKAGTTARAFLSEPLERLEGIRKDVNALLEKNGARVGCLDGTFFIPIPRMKRVLMELNKLKSLFDGEIRSIVANYGDIVSQTRDELEKKIEDKEVLKDALTRIPGKTEFEKRNSFSIQVFTIALPKGGEDEELDKLLKGSAATSVVSAEEAFKARLFGPFVEMAKNCSRKNYAGILGRKMAALKKAIDAVKAQVPNLKLVFREGDDAELLGKACNLINEVEAHFLHEHPLANVKTLEPWIVKKFWKVAEIFSGEKELRDFLASGEDLWADGFDLSNKRGMVAILNGAPAPVPAAKPETEAEEEGHSLDLFDPEPAAPAPAPAREPGEAAEAAPVAESADADARLAELLKACADERKLEEAAAQRAKALEEAQCAAPAATVVGDGDAVELKAVEPEAEPVKAPAEGGTEAEPVKAPAEEEPASAAPAKVEEEADASGIDFSDPEKAADFLSRNFSEMREVPDGMFKASSADEAEQHLPALQADAEPETVKSSGEVAEAVESHSAAFHEESCVNRGFSGVISDTPLF